MQQRIYRYIIAAMLAVLATMCVKGAPRSIEDPGSGRISHYKGWYWDVDANGDSTVHFVLVDLMVYPPLKFKNTKEKEEYDRLVRNVKITLPYAKLIGETLIETYEYIQTFPTQKERDDYLKKMEDELFKQYKPILKKFSKTQARVLIKLVQRETHQSSYNIVKAFLGTFRASFWQGFGALFGVSLKSTYDPDNNPEDSRMERVASQVELGIL